MQLMQEQPVGYHFTRRCARRSFLCDVGELTGNGYSHRKD